MFFRLKKSGQRGYVQIVENKRDGAAVRQKVIANIGRADELAASGALASLIASGAKLTDQVLLINALDEDAEGALSVAAKRIGGPLLFGRIWERLGIDAVLADLLMERAFEFPVERAVFVAALHRLFVSGSDRDCAWLARSLVVVRFCRRRRRRRRRSFVVRSSSFVVVVARFVRSGWCRASPTSASGSAMSSKRPVRFGRRQRPRSAGIRGATYVSLERVPPFASSGNLAALDHAGK